MKLRYAIFIKRILYWIVLDYDKSQLVYSPYIIDSWGRTSCY